jgi:DNA polymerase (family 10)
MAHKGKFTRTQADYDIHKIEENLKGIRTLKLCGSYRRECQRVGDLDYVVVVDNMQDFINSVHNIAKEVLALGPKRIRILLPSDLQVDFMMVDYKNYESAILHSTGSKIFNIKCRQKAKDKGYKLNEYGLFYNIPGYDSYGKEVAYSEQGILNALEMVNYLNPKSRNIFKF